jgi:lipopolysaccharide/colanic/teichoic acid biosynthesis glycosyltransferase
VLRPQFDHFDRTATVPATTFVRRALDIVIAGVALILLSPVFTLVCSAILFTDGRPIFFSQSRLGYKGRRFSIYKFRKFNKNCGTSGLAVTIKDDYRMTALGRILEKTKLDELPQLWNILKGDMSIVGPRPESLRLADCFTDEYKSILEYTPGIFGPNQIYFINESVMYPNNTDPELFYRQVLFPQKAANDLAYFPSRTLLSDLRWIVRGLLTTLRVSHSNRRGWTDHQLLQTSGNEAQYDLPEDAPTLV